MCYYLVQVVLKGSKGTICQMCKNIQESNLDNQCLEFDNQTFYLHRTAYYRRKLNNYHHRKNKKQFRVLPFSLTIQSFKLNSLPRINHFRLDQSKTLEYIHYLSIGRIRSLFQFIHTKFPYIHLHLKQELIAHLDIGIERGLSIECN